MSRSDLDLGLCCSCRGVENVRNIIMLHQLAPIAGTGWGCFECDLPANGAIAVICDSCLEANKEIVDVCLGNSASRNRVSLKSLSAKTFDHDYFKHPEAWWFPDSPDIGTKDCICSLCRKQIDEVAVRIVQNEMEARFHQKCFSQVEEAFK